MNQQPASPSGSANPCGRSRRRKAEDDIIRDILKLQKVLQKEHKTASLFVCSSKFGLLQFGSNHVVDKFKSDSEEWVNAFGNDDNEIIDDDQILESDNEDDDLNDLRASLLPNKLPAVVFLMKYEELWEWITQEILKEH